MKPNSYYEDPCYGHQCDTYKLTYTLHAEAERIYSQWKSAKQVAFPFFKFLRDLGITPTTLEHWKTCRPTNLKVMEQVRLFCDVSVLDALSGDPKLMLEGYKLTKKEEKPTEEVSAVKQVDLSMLGNDFKT